MALSAFASLRHRNFRIFFIGQATRLVATKRITAGEVALFAFLQGCLSSVEIPARQSFFVELVSREDLTNAIALNSSAYNVARILGPSIAGVMIAKVGMAACYGLN